MCRLSLCLAASTCAYQLPQVTTIDLNPLTVLLRILGFLIAISVHEFSHAFAAHSLGDDTAQRAGRLTLNPLRHLDPFGALLIVLVGFGWGKPVPVDPRYLRHGRLGMAIVSAAGPLSNLAMAVLAALILRGLGEADVPLSPAVANVIVLFLVRALIGLNIALCVFNLLPIAPLDGFGVAVGVLPYAVAVPLARLRQYGPGILMLLLFSGYVVGFDLLGRILGPMNQALARPILQLAGLR